MNVIGHEAIRENIPEIGRAIGVRKEHLLVTIAPLGVVMGQAGADGSGAAGHAGNLASREHYIKGSDPFCLRRVDECYNARTDPILPA